MATSPNWTREELILAFNLYLKLPFGKMHKGNEEVKKLASILGRRTPDSVAIRLTNFASVDPYHQQRGVKGMDGGRRQVEPIWDEFVNNQQELVFESERILADYQGSTIEEMYPEIVFDLKDLVGEVKIRAVKVRVNQSVFRKMILKTYANQCVISGIDLPELLVAGHIIPWSENEHERLNPENGLCMSSLYDRAYEKGLICIDTDHKLLISKRLKADVSKKFYQEFFGRFEYQPIRVPKTYQPRKEFLEYRLNQFEL
ncbi:HNH endonuclease [Spirosoma utsteinense]|uniref:Restriction endonuclease n=1 Tax=Spirosoma utsteinense TaxID=2585773 RepID=A0ABR6W1R5_9BACT|nr:HNH endonuclease signature motif containing protein [Spirosoma utsteinense]MBC3784995.1 putative restriction endonuclease [Spirosoma utsteinense]MBC3790397.1 putative restriction endonuclease [Spirosoma utsteinense]